MLQRPRTRWLAPLFAATTLFACAEVRREPVSVDARAACAQLASLRILPAAIGLPTTGADVRSTDFVLASDAQNANGEYCKVLGAIHPVDPKAPDINFEINLPSDWNRKALQFGGGGFNGVLMTGLGPFVRQQAGTPTALRRGYVTFGSDGGHAGAVFDASFALNDEALANFAHREIKKTRDAMVAVTKARYGAPPKFVYIGGGSTGGRESLQAALRYPADYDGAIVYFPDLKPIPRVVTDHAFARTLYANNGSGWLSPGKATMLADAVYAKCDILDGAVDGIIGNVADCIKATALFSQPVSQNPLRCAGGIDAGDSCLSDIEITTLAALNSPLRVEYAPGVFASRPKGIAFEGGTFTKDFFLGYVLGTSRVPATPPAPPPATSLHYMFSQMSIRYMVTRNPSFDALAFDPMQWSNRIRDLEPDFETGTDFTPFKDHGGKIILVHGTADDIATPYGTIEYYESVVATMGHANVDAFMRFYLVHGMGHHRGVFNAGLDSLSALDAWVESGRPPGTLVAFDANPATKGRSRPVCVYPQWPRYDGTGDLNVAMSFTCVEGPG